VPENGVNWLKKEAAITGIAHGSTRHDIDAAFVREGRAADRAGDRRHRSR